MKNIGKEIKKPEFGDGGKKQISFEICFFPPSPNSGFTT